MKKEAIDHYNRMIEYVETQSGKDSVDLEKMQYSIGEAWYTYDCIYCMTNHYDTCKHCKLYKRIEVEEFYGFSECCGGLWHQMNMSKNWAEWLIYANKVKNYIKENG